MANINILDKSIFNRIAAGEVVEKPASVVKELVENSIDAKATNITIEVEMGGIKKIKVTDNGIGVDKENLPKAFLPHATSKISTLDDLDKIGTLGFRGEALSSIASVAKVTALSKIKGAEEGTKITLSGGEVENITFVGCTDGTQITVEDLFYCIPARAKFLRKPKTEESEITNLVSRLILANPEIIFKYVADGKTIYHSTGNGLQEAIYTIYGTNTIENILPVDYTYQNLIKVSGYIGKPSFVKANRTYQTILINGRYIINKTISTAIYSAYEPYLMKNAFPFFVLHVSLPLDKVDVNVHPNKLDVKFENNNLIYGAFYNPISEELQKLSSKIREYKTEEVTSNSNINLDNLQKISPLEGHQFESKPNNLENVKVATIDDNSQFVKEVELLSDSDRELQENLHTYLTNDSSDYMVKNSEFNTTLMTKLASQNHVFSQSSIFNEEQKVDLTKTKIIGTCFNTYIIVENNNSLYFIDQHAGHERLLYDKFKESFLNEKLAVQSLLVPYVFETNHLEMQFINDNLAVFSDLGFEIEAFGINSFKVSTVPVLLKEISLCDFFNTVLKDLDSIVNYNKADILKEYLEKKACRSAVKANDILSLSEIENLLKLLNNENQILLCPHGRPVIIEITEKEIEKWFKRIV